MEENKKKKQLKIEIDESVGQGEYVNFAIVTHSVAEFVLDFIRILPGLNKSKVRSRVVISPMHAKTFLKALQDNIDKYENKFGEIKVINNKEAVPDFNNLINKDTLPN
ncbi:MAG: hypothetical protein CMG66_04320 [Candidatus Marinimicrobia bacterium]|nr:hypothetical protein [Candidatus Neomarinimicrobiota bacterium]|tara:strand:+ start:11517 stop:11840 length:324 start_codon:yes stop_codon:yes gene_type:complete